MPSASALAAAAVVPLEIGDPAPPVDVLPYPLWMVLVAAVLGLALVALACRAVLRRLRTRQPAPPPTPRETALRALVQVRERLGVLEPYAFSILVSEVLRRYVTEQYRLQATAQTSPEFLAAIAGAPEFGDHEKGLLAAFLEKVDLIKFARLEATVEDCAALLRQAQDFVEGGAR